MSALPRPARAPAPDPAEVAARLEMIAAATEGDDAERRRLALAVLKETLEQGRASARARLDAGAGGVEVARELCSAADVVVRALWDFAHVHVLRTRNPTAGERLALIATGGYGRGVLAPYSDLDLLFLRPWKETAFSESLIEFMLYALWDLGLKVGWASRSIDECVKLSREDMTIRTALLEMRPLAGEAALAEKLRARFVKDVIKGTAAAFVEAKLKERDARHAKSGASRYQVEPNVKDGKGGLRDLNTLFWIARYFAPESPLGLKTLKTLYSGKEQRTFEQAFDFLWAVRIRLHFAAGRAEERLGFDRQAELAAQMGYAGRGEAPAVERFMRRYFLTAKEVGALTRTFCAKLEADRIKAPQGLSRLLPSRRRRKKKLDVEGFVEDDGRLSIAGPKVFEQDPVNLLRLFRTADQMDLDLHPDAFTAVSRSLALVTPKLRRDPEAARAFLDVLARGNQPYRILTLMNDAGLLGRFLPEFGRIVAQTQLNMYHAYTVDDHTLRAVGIIKDIEQGRLAEEHPLSASILPMIADREALYLAMLLHDTGKGGSRGQAVDGAIAARRACERLGLSRRKGELVSWLVEHHLVLSDFAQKRDVADPDTVAAFARIVENPERLRLLLVLTVADVRAVGPGVWNGWKGQLMRDLYSATEAAFRGGRGADPAAGVRTRQAELAEAARRRLIEVDPAAADWAASMEDAYFSAFDAEEQAAHADLVRRAETTGAAASARTRVTRNAAELVLAARDRKGLF
ncbi:[protein-PII] uridylyltransferase, partial [Caulobacter sp. 17J65-9]|uniref:[protein-PII] uridylyltransferase n=1 Tax=Caulobacter sp. 17J65-9 TaxID=2709382 RepID=UPI0013C8055E